MKIQKRTFVDELDLFLLKQIYDSFKKNEETNTWLLAKLFIAQKTNKKDIDNVYNKNKAEVDYVYRRIDYKMKQYKKMNIIKIFVQGDGENILGLNFDEIAFAKHKFPDGYKECFLISAEKFQEKSPTTF